MSTNDLTSATGADPEPDTRRTITTLEDLAVMSVDSLLRDGNQMPVILSPGQVRGGGLDLVRPRTGRRCAVKYAAKHLPLTVEWAGPDTTTTNSETREGTSPAQVATQPTALMPFTRREYLVLHAVRAGASFAMAREAVSSVAIEHPEWDLAETKTFEEWDER